MDRPLRVLIVDDDADIHDALQVAILDGDDDPTWSVEVDHAYSGTEALAKMKARRPDLLILDVRMPEMDGFALREEMLHDEDLVDVMVCACTGHHMTDTEIQVLMAHHHLPKPPELAELRAVLVDAAADAAERDAGGSSRQLARLEREVRRVATLKSDVAELEDRLKIRAEKLRRDQEEQEENKS